MFAWRSRIRLVRRSPGRRGAAAVEFALAAPILFMLLFGALEMGRMNMIRNTANNAAYEAVRTCVVPGATNAEGVAAAQKLLASIGVKGSTVLVTPATIVDTTPSVSATVTVPFDANMWVAPLYSLHRSTSVTCTMTRDWVVSTR